MQNELRAVVRRCARGSPDATGYADQTGVRVRFLGHIPQRARNAQAKGLRRMRCGDARFCVHFFPSLDIRCRVCVHKLALHFKDDPATQCSV